MRCVKCSNEAKITIANLSSCARCFEKILEKRIRNEIRQNRLFEKEDVVLFIDDKSAEAKISEYFVKKILSRSPIRFSSKEHKYSLGMRIRAAANKIVIPWNTDLEGDYLLGSVFANKSHPFLGHFRQAGKLYVKPLLHVLHEECEAFAKSKGIAFDSGNKGDDLIGELEKEYPELKFSLMKSAGQIKSIK